ncbi:hypothetical protein [Aurantiacibacter sp. D1-12]|uniref:hypothetical protein n=1 Tax=Aurantiacibacter sp. D1-12 TaxID=2993658 RepID=UPI00237C734F|nr:hypothetical protein [Aurantiacibacter sp. D1-12]MDE1468354.1 hypothetical protein [Aurantiacibacter sp. D1-12]
MSFTSIAAVEMTSFCFDCPVEDPGFSIAPFLNAFLFAAVLAAPGFLVGMWVHRQFDQYTISARLVVVAMTVPLFWFVWFSGQAGAGWADGILSASGYALRNLFYDTLPFFAGGLFAAGASYFDARRVEAQRNGTYFRDY